MNNTFYLKYRPQRIEELDIEPVRTSLEKIVKKGRIPHAYLFAGPKGTGKTSAARILAKTINCESSSKVKGYICNKCEQCKSIADGTNIDVIEMDAASNRGIDDIRSLRDVVKLAPAKAKAKVYIIDEAHMLTLEASNALLKTLEEPPSHVYFILATTNPEKLIETIKSRTTIINFRKANPEEIKRSLKRIVRGEKINISVKNIEKIIKLSKGSFRDAVKLLERVATEGVGFLKDDENSVESLVLSIEEKNSPSVYVKLEELFKKGVSPLYLTEVLLDYFRQKLVFPTKYSLEKEEIIYLVELLIVSIDQVKISPIEELPLELAFHKWFIKINGPSNVEKNS